MSEAEVCPLRLIAKILEALELDKQDKDKFLYTDIGALLIELHNLLDNEN